MAVATLPVAGQGVFLFSLLIGAPAASFRLLSADKTNGLNIEFSKEGVTVTEIASLKPLRDENNKTGLSSHAGAYYWFSVDAQNQRLYAGVGEARLETVVYTYSFPAPDVAAHKANKAFLESIVQVEYPATLEKIRILKDPVTAPVALAVKDMDELTMEDIASGAYMPKANLPAIAQKLYDCIAGKQFVLDTPDFPDFTQAIEYNIRTPGLWCYNKLRDKSREFNPDKPDLSETYLRITLGQNNGESPGIPYVMEIWPVGHYSPIHSHANATAVIRVLNGEINVSMFPFLCAEKDGVKPFGAATFTKGDVTWITPTLNQTHQLKNMETNTYTCITIQCYMYTEKDKRHYDYFDYLDADGAQQPYEPDSDMDFLAFKAKIREQWNARPSRWMRLVRSIKGRAEKPRSEGLQLRSAPSAPSAPAT